MTVSGVSRQNQNTVLVILINLSIAYTNLMVEAISANVPIRHRIKLSQCLSEYASKSGTCRGLGTWFG